MIELITLKSNTEVAASEWIHILPLGDVLIDGDTPAVFDTESAESVINKYKARSSDMVIDYEHQTLSGNVAPAAGWVKSLEMRDDGLWGKVEWTDKAKGYLDTKEYRYHSPVFMMRKSDRKIIELHNLALTNQPRMLNIKAITNKQFLNEGGQVMPDTQENSNGLAEKLIKKLGLDAGASVDDIFGAIEKMFEKMSSGETAESVPVANKKVFEAVGLPETAAESELIASIHALKQSASKPDLTTEVMSLKKRLAERDRDDIVMAALKAGKITTAQKEWADKYAYEDPDGFKLFVAKSPVVVPVTDSGVTDVEKKVLKDTPDDDQAKINQMLNITPEKWKKYADKEVSV